MTPVRANSICKLSRLGWCRNLEIVLIPCRMISVLFIRDCESLMSWLAKKLKVF